MAVKRRSCTETSVCAKHERGAKPLKKTFSPYGTDLFGKPAIPPGQNTLAARFTLPPFSVLNAREGDWQDRKRAWISLGIQSEIGRGGGGRSPETGKKLAFAYQGQDTLNPIQAQNRVSPGGSPRPAMDYSKRERGDGRGRPLNKRTTWVAGDRAAEDLDEVSKKILASGGQGQETTGTSIFDPVLCELMYDWFCPNGGQIIDPFAGGSVRGIVATLMGRDYWGCDLRQEQIDANNEQAQHICSGKRPAWVCGDSTDLLAGAPKGDFVFSCPPYGDLEQYSDDPRDLSIFDYPDFLTAYEKIIKGAAKRLKEDRFACFVVGEFRNKKTHHYRGFVPDTINIFQRHGLMLYNELILVTAVGSLPIRTGKQFVSGRKLGKTHQNVLVFVKGDWKAAAEACNNGVDE